MRAGAANAGEKNNDRQFPKTSHSVVHNQYFRLFCLRRGQEELLGFEVECHGFPPGAVSPGCKVTSKLPWTILCACCETKSIVVMGQWPAKISKQFRMV